MLVKDKVRASILYMLFLKIIMTSKNNTPNEEVGYTKKFVVQIVVQMKKAATKKSL